VLEGEPTGSTRFIEHAEQMIKESRPLDVAVLERYMLLLNDLSGVTARSLFRPSLGELGASELVIIWEERKLAGSVELDNFGTRFLGPVQLGGTAAASNLTGNYDGTQLRGLVTAQIEELQYLSLSHTEPLGVEGTALTLTGSASWTEPQQLGPLQGVDTEGHSYFGSLIATHPLIRSRARNLSLFGGFRAQNSDNDTFGDRISSDRTRALTAGATFDLVDAYRGVSLLGVDIAQGLDAFGARDSEDDPPPSRGEAEPAFTRMQLSASRDQDLPGPFSVRVALSSQYSLDPLPASEQFGVGGDIFGRGYGPYEIAGDQALAGTIQLQYGGAWPFVRLAELVESYQLYGFFDAGHVWRKNEPGADSDGLASTGAGIDLNVARDVALTFLVAMPLTRDPSTLSNPEDRYPRPFFRLSKRF
jgi:hemolysin activation/secretion protein